MESKRLNKFISDSGFCSRREADRLIEEERVTVNGKLPAPGTLVTAKDKVRIDDQILRVKDEAPVFLILNKPAGMSAKSDPAVRDNVVRAINHPATLEPIGYLERDAEGLLFLSNETELVRKINRADNKFEKEYIVTVDKLISSDFISRLRGGGETERGEGTARTFVEKVGSSRFKIVLAPGTNHNIKMLCENLGYKVTHLQRTRIHDFTLAKMPSGHWRALTPAEVDKLREIASSKNIAIADNRGGYSVSHTPAKPARTEGRKSTSESRKSGKPASGLRDGKSRVKDKSTSAKNSTSRRSTGSTRPGTKNNSRRDSSKGRSR